MTAAKVERVAREMYEEAERGDPGITRVPFDSLASADIKRCFLALARWHIREIAKAERRGAEKAMHARIRVAAYNPAWTGVANPVTVKVAKRRKR